MNTRYVFNVPHEMYRMKPGEVIELQNAEFTRTAHSAHVCFSRAEGITYLRADIPTQKRPRSAGVSNSNPLRYSANQHYLAALT